MDLRRYLVDRKVEIGELEVKPRLISATPTPHFITAVVGPRRAGKTYFLYHLVKSLGLADWEYLFANFEEYVDWGDPTALPAVHLELYGREPRYIFLDEVQALPQWHRVVYTLYERKRYSIVITGSSSRLLARELAAQLRGRTAAVRVLPFSLREILAIHGISSPPVGNYAEARARHIVLESLHSQFPDIVLGRAHPRQFFSDYIDLVIYKDIVERYGFRKRAQLEYFIYALISSNCRELSVRRIIQAMGSNTSKNTVYAFAKAVEDVHMAFYLRRYAGSPRKSLLTTPKVYLVDPGLYNYVQGLDRSKTLENVVFLELVKSGLTPNREIFYLRQGRREVDFVVLTPKPLAVEAAWEADQEHIQKAAEAAEQLHAKKAQVVTWDQEDQVKVGTVTVHVIPLWRWIYTITT